MKLKSHVLTAALVAAAAALTARETPRQYVHEPAQNSAPLPFSDAVRVAETLYVAGHIGIDPKTGQAAQDAVAEAKLVMDAFQATIASAGLTPDDLVSVTVYCTDLALYDIFQCGLPSVVSWEVPGACVYRRCPAGARRSLRSSGHSSQVDSRAQGKVILAERRN